MVTSKKKCKLSNLKVSSSKSNSTKCTSCKGPLRFTVSTEGVEHTPGQELEESSFYEVLARARSHGVEALIVGVYIDDLIPTIQV